MAVWWAVGWAGGGPSSSRCLLSPSVSATTDTLRLPERTKASMVRMSSQCNAAVTNRHMRRHCVVYSVVVRGKSVGQSGLHDVKM